MNTYFLDQENYLFFLLQFFTSNFLHGGILHFFMNAIFLYYFGNIVETILGKKLYFLFFLGNIFFVGFFLLFSHAGNTVGISAFCMALLSYYTLYLYSNHNPEYKGGVTAIVINILIGLNPQISLLGHLGGAILGIIFYLLKNKKLLI